MKATIEKSGMLSIIPENEVEAYAIRCYMEKFNSDTPPAIRFAWDAPIHSLPLPNEDPQP